MNFYEIRDWSIIFNVLSGSILLIIRFLFFFVGKVLVATERISEITSDVNIFVENVSGTTEKFSNEVLFYFIIASEL